MPGTFLPDTHTGITADILRQLRRRQNAAAASQALIWEYDEFAITGAGDTTHTLSWLPYGINVIALNGLVLRQGTDYTVNMTTGLVTVVATLTAGDVLLASYVTTGELKVYSLPADTGAITDNFNRANASSLGTASDGGVWSNGTAFSIIGNKAGANGSSIALRDVGSMSATISVTMTQGAFGAASRVAYLAFAYDAGSGVGYRLLMGTNGGFQLIRDPAGTVVGGTTLTGTSWSANSGATPGGPTTIQAAFDATTWTMTVTQDGTLVGSITDSTPATLTGTSVGIQDGISYSSSQILFDNFSAV